MQLIEVIYIESVEVCAIKDPMPADGPCVFTGKTAIYFGEEDNFDDNKGHILLPNQPLAVCDKTAGALTAFETEKIFLFLNLPGFMMVVVVVKRFSFFFLLFYRKKNCL